MMASQQEFMIEQRQFVTLKHQTNAMTKQSIQRVEGQMGQMARELSEIRKCEFPTQTISNPTSHQ
jgi:hypothetical protein